MAFAAMIAAGTISMINGIGVIAPGERPRLPAKSPHAQ
jgi:hypothetical protein